MTTILREKENNPQPLLGRANNSRLRREASKSLDLATNAAYLTLCDQQRIPLEVANIAGKGTYKRNATRREHRSVAYWLSKCKKVDGSSQFKNDTSSDESKVDEQIVWALQQTPLSPNIADAALVLQQNAKSDILANIQDSYGDITNSRFLKALNVLSSIYVGYGRDSRTAYKHNCEGVQLDGSWVSLSKPSFPGCLGNNTEGDYMYTLGRMSFGMFLPTRLKCSIQRVYNEIELVDRNDELPSSIPMGLQKALQLTTAKNTCFDRPTANQLIKHNVVIHFTIEPTNERSSKILQEMPAPLSPIRGVMTNHGYMLPDPNIPNRFTVWFTGGELGPFLADESSPLSPSISSSTCSLTLHRCRYKNKMCALHGLGTNTAETPLEWEKIFGKEEHWKRTLGERTKALAAKVIIGASVPEYMEEDGTVNYAMHRPMEGHVDVIYMDEDLRITKGNYGTILVQRRAKEYEETILESVLPSIPSQPLPIIIDDKAFFSVGMNLDGEI